MANVKPLVISTTGNITEIGSADFLNAPVVGPVLTTALNDDVGALTKGDVVYRKGTNTVGKADSDAIATAWPIVGITYSATVAVGATGYFQMDGPMTAILSGATAGTLYFLSGTPAALTTTVPTAASSVVVQMGHAINATDFFISINQAPLIRT